ncbi:MAG TPA: cupin domain-containing protein [Amycolatopsis sp.]|uniref:cupin domain-containing protein n=1 Tax=Amycolatopsis sp. TaxID=37632 RepID=UPI002B486DCC|nr:cupin domain-containing protein [Amycolatopsis sp.]HKS49738.1 cupin domain-containing protein [Amycolatopsis sp.]
MRNVHRFRLVGACLLAVVVAVAPATAAATQSHGVTAKIIAQSTVDGKDYILREITVAPGGGTGWHFHQGTLYGLVRQGTLTHNAADCAVDGIYHAGDALTEPSGREHVHIGRNLGATPLVLDVLYVDPAGSPLSDDAPNPGCPFQ